MLRRFSSITSCGIFQNFRWNSVAPDFQRINLIYGPNGSGKTSLANALADLSSESTSYSKVSICMSNADKTNERNSDKKLDNEFQRIFVFGDGYVKQNLQFDGDADSTVAAVLTVGKRTIQEEARIAELKPLIDQSEKDLTDAKKGLANAQKNLDNRYRTLASSIVASLSRAGGLYKSNGTYHKGIVKSLFDQSHDSWKLLTPEQKKISIATVNSDEKKPVSSRSFSFQVRTDLGQDVINVLKETPVTVVLDTLSDHPEATNWVDEGRHLHSGLDQCLFCGAPLTDARKRQIEQHFSDEVTKVQSTVDGLIREVQASKETIASLLGDGTLSGSLFDDLQEPFNTAYAEAETQVKALDEWLDGILTILQKKRANVLNSVDFTSSATPIVDGSSIESLLTAHNDRVTRHTSDVQKAAKSLEVNFLKEAETEVQQLKNTVQQASTKESEIGESLNGENGYRVELATLTSSEGDPLPSAESMTSELVRILGRQELSFRLTPDGKHYNVARYDQPARNLSTGERTAIALIHFLETIKHSTATNGKPIVVIDDPVSSLDRAVAMGISTYIWSETVACEDTEQVFLLTHSFELFRQWDIQIDGLTGSRGPNNNKGYTSNTYELASHYCHIQGEFIRTPVLSAWPPNENVRKKVRSSYHHAFMTAAYAHNELMNDSSMEKKLDATLLYPNVLRRLLETFLAFKTPASNNGFAGAMRDMGAKLESMGYQGDPNALRLELTRFTHAYSHADSPETDTVMNPDEIGSTITAVFTFMNAIDQDHFRGLCQLIGADPKQLLQEPKPKDNTRKEVHNV